MSGNAWEWCTVSSSSNTAIFWKRQIVIALTALTGLGGAFPGHGIRIEFCTRISTAKHEVLFHPDLPRRSGYNLWSETRGLFRPDFTRSLAAKWSQPIVVIFTPGDSGFCSREICLQLETSA